MLASWRAFGENAIANFDFSRPSNVLETLNCGLSSPSSNRSVLTQSSLLIPTTADSHSANTRVSSLNQLAVSAHVLAGMRGRLAWKLHEKSCARVGQRLGKRWEICQKSADFQTKNFEGAKSA